MNNIFIHVDFTLVFIAVAVLFAQRTEEKKKIEKKLLFYRQSTDKSYSTELERQDRESTLRFITDCLDLLKKKS